MNLDDCLYLYHPEVEEISKVRTHRGRRFATIRQFSSGMHQYVIENKPMHITSPYMYKSAKQARDAARETIKIHLTKEKKIDTSKSRRGFKRRRK